MRILSYVGFPWVRLVRSRGARLKATRQARGFKVRRFQKNRQKLGRLLATLFRAGLDVGLTLVGALDVRALAVRRPLGRRRIAFQAYSVHLAQVFKPIIDVLRRDPDGIELSFIILLHPQFPLNSLGELRRFARDDLGFPEAAILFQWQALWRRFDLILYADVYASFPWRAAKHAVLMHGAGLRARMFESHLLRRSIADFDYVLVNGDYDARLARPVLDARGQGKQLLVAGFPFLDRLQQVSITREEYLARLGLEPARPTVLVAPHWEALRLVERTPCYVDEIVAALSPLNVNIILKLHACSFNRDMGGPVDWSAEMAAIGASGVARIDTDLDDLVALTHADLLITDLSSRSFVFMMVGKPVILYYPFPKDWDTVARARWRQMERGAVVASAVADIAPLVAEAARRGWTNPVGLEVGQECFSFQGCATDRVVAILKDVVT